MLMIIYEREYINIHNLLIFIEKKENKNFKTNYSGREGIVWRRQGRSWTLYLCSSQVGLK